MSYSDFTLEKVKQSFGLTIVENTVLFPDVTPQEPSQLLTQWLKEYVSLAVAINTEKARSEFLIAPLLGEVRKQLSGRVALFSGIDFNVDAEKGLSGFCDYLISAGAEQFYLEAPVIAVVEAKNENIKSGLGQCIAEMVAAQIFNQQRQNPIKTIAGCVTTGQIYRFIKLEDSVVTIDATDYYINDVASILGIFVQLRSAIAL